MKRALLLGSALALTLGAIAWGQQPGVNTTLNTVFNIPLDGSKRTYGAAIAAVSPGSATATDVFEICGSSAIVRISKLEISGRATAVSSADVAVLRRSTAAQGGTYDPVTPVGFDTTHAAATATLKAFNLNPTTLGTLTGALVQRQLQFGNLTTGLGGPPVIFTFPGRTTASPLTLRGATQCIVINLNGGGPFTGNSIDMAAEWTEE